MSDYTKTTNFTAKDALPTGNPSKIIKGEEHDTEFDAIETAVATKANKIVGGTANNVVEQDANGDIVDTGLATPTGTFVGTTDTQTLTNKTLTAPVITGLILNDGSFLVEGATADDFETTVQFEDPTADVTVTVPAATTQLVGRDTTDTLTNKTIDGSQLVDSSVSGEKMEDATAGDYVDGWIKDGAFTFNTTYTKKLEIKIPRDGTFRIRIGATSWTAANPRLRIYKNGVAHGTERTSFAGVNEDLAFLEGDLCQLYIRDSVDSSGSGTVLILYVMSNNPIAGKASPLYSLGDI